MVKDTPAVVTYASVVSCDIVRNALMIAPINGLEVKASDIMNAFLNALYAEKI